MLTDHNQPENQQAADSGKAKRKDRIIRISEDSFLNEAIIEELESLFQFTSPTELSRCLRDVFMLSLKEDNHILQKGLQRKAENFWFLIQFLERVEEEMEK